jgi:hypothetical protein
MFTYLTLGGNDFSRSISFYDAVMATLGHARCDTSAEDGDEWGDFVGWGHLRGRRPHTNRVVDLQAI